MAQNFATFLDGLSIKNSTIFEDEHVQKQERLGVVARYDTDNRTWEDNSMVILKIH